jgi:hypothetical protein
MQHILILTTNLNIETVARENVKHFFRNVPFSRWKCNVAEHRTTAKRAINNVQAVMAIRQYVKCQSATTRDRLYILACTRKQGATSVVNLVWYISNTEAITVIPYSWFSRDVIAAMLVSHEQKISH